MKSNTITLHFETDLPPERVEEFVTELLVEAREHLLEGENVCASFLDPRQQPECTRRTR